MHSPFIDQLHARVLEQLLGAHRLLYPFCGSKLFRLQAGKPIGEHLPFTFDPHAGPFGIDHCSRHQRMGRFQHPFHGQQKLLGLSLPGQWKRSLCKFVGKLTLATRSSTLRDNMIYTSTCSAVR